MNSKRNAGSSSGEQKQVTDSEVEKVVEISLERLRPFENHPFKVRDDEAMEQLMESIEKYGIMNPLVVMPTMEGVYRIISGHRRKYCAEELGYTKVPVIIRYMKEDDWARFIRTELTVKQSSLQMHIAILCRWHWNMESERLHFLLFLPVFIVILWKKQQKLQ